MSERRRCIRCDRGIDAWAKICPFCNQDQSDPVPAVASPVAEYTPPAEKSLKRKLLLFGGGLLMLMAAFGVGMVINRDGTPDKAPETIEEQIAENEPKPTPAKRADTQLIPVNEPIDQPITSAPMATPAAGMPNEYQRHDATAVSSVEYAQLAARAQAERKATAQQAAVDPRSITGRAYAQAPPRHTIARPPVDPARQGSQQQQTPMTSAAPAPGSSISGAAVPRTRPVPEYQPVPNISVARSQTVRLDLMVGADGRVEEVKLRDTVPGQTARIISTVQRWRFKPATENGRPVAAPVSVDISFRGND